MRGLFFVLFLFSASAFAQKKSEYQGFPSLVWPKLYDIQYVKAKDKLGEYDKPVFTDQTKALHGKTITIPGYMVPFENGVKGSKFMLSSLPLNACFFCGVGGPETVVEVHLKEPVTYKEKPIEVKGTLVLNDKDPDKMMYILQDAVVIGEIGF